MRSLRKHIALSLLWIFFLPILLQSAHVMWHCMHNRMEAEHHCCCHASEKSDSHVLGFMPAKKICKICSYHFSINELPQHVFVLQDIPYCHYTYQESTSSAYCLHVIDLHDGRAPPFAMA